MHADTTTLTAPQTPNTLDHLHTALDNLWLDRIFNGAAPTEFAGTAHQQLTLRDGAPAIHGHLDIDGIHADISLPPNWRTLVNEHFLIPLIDGQFIVAITHAHADGSYRVITIDALTDSTFTPTSTHRYPLVFRPADLRTDFGEPRVRITHDWIATDLPGI